MSETLRMLEGIRERTAQPRPMLVRWGDTLQALVVASVAQKRTPEGNAWTPRKTVTRVGNRIVARKQSRPKGQLGNVSGRMVASVRTSVGARAVIVEAGAPYARFFSAGTRYQPSRALLPRAQRGPYATAFAGFVRSLADYTVSGRAV